MWDLIAAWEQWLIPDGRYNSGVKPSNLSRAFQFGASVDGNLQAHCKKCGNEATIERDGPPARHKLTVSCKRCNIAVSGRGFIKVSPGPSLLRAARYKVISTPSPPGLRTALLGGWAPGAVPLPKDETLSRPVKQGSDLVIQIHYHPSGKSEQARVEVSMT